MTDLPASPLTSQTLERLHKLAEGNNVAPQSIELVETQERIYKLDGVLQLVPFCEKQTGKPAAEVGAIKNRQTLPNFAALQAAVQAHQQKFLESKDWIEAARKEIGAASGEGWGVDGARVTLPERSVIFTALEPCPTCQGRKLITCVQCQGQGFIVCPTCQGRGQEICYNCNGTGQNPSHPGQRCIICQGNRYVPCRFCRASGRLVCPTCQGKRGTPCPSCQGKGLITQELTLVCGAVAQFKVKGEELPSGLRRGLERLGIANLAKGHADIKMLTPAQTEDEAEKEKTSSKPEIRYEAQLPYADIRMRFGGGRVVMVSAFGKRGLLMGVPVFLDNALKPAREALSEAAEGKDTFQLALSARAIREALTIDLSGKSDIKALRRIYPIGLSPEAASEILKNIHRALGHFTKRARITAALIGGLGGAGILAGWFLTPIHVGVTAALPPGAGLAADILVFAIALGFGWTILSKAMQIALRRRFPNLMISMRRPIGTIGYSMFAGIVVAGLAILMLAPVKPIWFAAILRMIGFG